MNQLQTLTPSNDSNLPAFSSGSAFESAQRMAKALAASDMVPSQYKGNIANSLVALEIAQRTGSSVLAVMQSLNIIHGRPSWSSQYIIAAINSCGRFKPLRFRIEGQGSERTCIAWTTDESGEVLEGPPVSMAMAKAEGWIDKNGSKWKTMPELMLRYRAAAFFGRLYAPEVLMGMQTDDELRDVTPPQATGDATINKLNQRIRSSRKKDAREAVKSEETAESKLADEQVTDGELTPPANGEKSGTEFF